MPNNLSFTMAKISKDDDLSTGLNNLKKHIFNELMDLVGRVFIIVGFSEDVKIGNRGFLPEEKEKGLVLVFNRGMNFKWHDWGIEAKLAFGSTPQECLVPIEHIIGIYSPEAGTQFLSLPAESTQQSEERKEGKEGKTQDKVEGSKVVKVDFGKK